MEKRNIINLKPEDYEKLSIEELDKLIDEIKKEISLLKYADNNKEYIREVLALIDE